METSKVYPPRHLQDGRSSRENRRRDMPNMSARAARRPLRAERRRPHGAAPGIANQPFAARCSQHLEQVCRVLAGILIAVAYIECLRSVGGAG